MLINFARSFSAFLSLIIRAAAGCGAIVASVVTASPASVGAQSVRGKSLVERRKIKQTIQFIEASRATDRMRESDVVDSRSRAVTIETFDLIRGQTFTVTRIEDHPAQLIQKLVDGARKPGSDT